MGKTLIYGYGNPGREDDALGVVLADRLQAWIERTAIPGYGFDRNYQLNIEDALEVSQYDLVLFADASMEPVDNFLVSRVAPCERVQFTMHAVDPSYILYLSREIFGRSPATFLIHIKGYQWQLKEGLSAAAHQNLEDAVAFVQSAIRGPEILEKQLEAAADLAKQREEQ